MNDMTTGSCDGAGRSCQVSPRSVERNSRESATSVQTTVPVGVSICAVFGSGINVGGAVAATVAVGAAVAVTAVGVEVGVGLAAATLGDALGAAAGVPQAASARTKRSAVSRLM